MDPFGLFKNGGLSNSISLLPLHRGSSPSIAVSSPRDQSRDEPRTSESPHQAKSLKAKPLPSEPLQALSRQDAFLQDHLQELLDAQSEGLLAGLGSDTHEADSSTGTRTPTMSPTSSRRHSHTRFSSPTPIRQPRTQKLSLRSARRQLARTILELAQVKQQEASALQNEVSHRTSTLSTIDRLSDKTSQLQAEIDRIEISEASPQGVNAEVARMKSTERELNASIREHELRLLEMKAQQRHLIREIQTRENSVQSRLSSYRHALRLAEQESREWLARPPPAVSVRAVGISGPIYTNTKSVDKGKRRDEVPSNLWTLPPQRRTLDMAREQIADEQKTLEEQIAAISDEKHALDEGLEVWKSVVDEVRNVEKMLQSEMKNLCSAPQQGDAETSPSNGAAASAEQGMGTVLRRLDEAVEKIQQWLELAQEKKWKLLICCIGAELEALKQGQAVLEEAVAPPAETAVKEKLDEPAARHHQRGDSFRTAEEENQREGGRSDEDDDGPGADLLISHDEE